MVKTIFFIIGVSFLSLFLSGHCQAQETITISTYYPSPRGVYGTLRLTPRSQPPASGKPGELCFIDGTDLMYGKGLYIYVDDSERWKPAAGDTESKLPLVNSAHTVGDCLKAGGEVVDTDTGFQQCRFNRESCPSGWAQYKYYSTCEAASCASPSGYTGSCSTNAKAWANASYNIGAPGYSPYCPPIDCPVCAYNFRWWGGGGQYCCYASKSPFTAEIVSGKRTQIGCY